MFLHEYFVVVSIAAVMNAVDFLWGIVVGLVLACIIMVVNVSRCCKRRRAACARSRSTAARLSAAGRQWCGRSTQASQCARRSCACLHTRLVLPKHTRTHTLTHARTGAVQTASAALHIE